MKELFEEPSDNFWLSDPTILYKEQDIFPRKDMTNTQRLNSLTRLLILISLVLLLFNPTIALSVFGLGIIMILLLRGNHKTEHFGPHRGNHDPCHTCGMDSTMAYINTKYETTPLNQSSPAIDHPRSWTKFKYLVKPLYVPPAMSDVWRNEPRYCNEFSQFPTPYTISKKSSINNLPTPKCQHERDQYVYLGPENQCAPPKVSAMPAIQSAFMRDSLTFRNNIMGEIVDQFERQRQHNCVGFKPGRKTF